MFGFIAFMTNFIVTIMMVMGAVVVTNVLTGVNSYGACCCFSVCSELPPQEALGVIADRRRIFFSFVSVVLLMCKASSSGASSLPSRTTHLVRSSVRAVRADLVCCLLCML